MRSLVKPYRLPSNVRPTHYEIEIDARLEKETFAGRVTIALQVGAGAPRIELHAREIDITKATLAQLGKSMDARIAPQPDIEMVALDFGAPLVEGPASLEIEYVGHVQKNMEGLYRSKDGADEVFSTQCEETDARAIFPCFDEPAFKARFAWRVTTDAENTVLANGPLESVDATKDGSKRWVFQATKPMSSYLCALAVGKLASTSEEVVRGVPFRVWAVKGKEHFGGFGQAMATKLMPWYEDYFQASYHFDKYDQVAVPSFSAGAMENSGLVIFRQALLLLDPKAASFREEKRVALVIAHEFAHMWFGNLVTMAWWDDIWLNESFAEWIAHKAMDAVEPRYKVWNDFMAGKSAALVPDSLASTHPIYTPVETPEQATELFDLITYQKGSSVLRMLEGFLGEAPFRDGLRGYMKEFAEGNAKGGDLWRHLERASGRPVTRIMESWILQGGHPVVSASLDGTTLKLSQRRFYSAPGVKDPGQVWAVPLVVRWRDDAGAHESRHLLDAKEGSLVLSAKGRVHWAHLNLDGIGFYRQDLDAGLLRALVAGFDQLTAMEQVSFLEDQWALVRSGSHKIAAYLDVLDAAMTHATHHAVLERIGALASTLEWMLEESGDQAALARFRQWVARKMAPRFETLGFEPRKGEPIEDAQARVALYEILAGIAHDPTALARAAALADAEANDPAGADANLAAPAVALSAQFGDAKRFDRYLHAYESRVASRAPPQLTQRYLNALAYFREPALLTRGLDLLTARKLPLEAGGPLLRLMLQRRPSQVVAWQWMTSHWDYVRQNLGDQWTGFLVENTGNLPPRLIPEIVKFYNANLTVAHQARGRAMESLAQRDELMRRTKGDLVAWFGR